MGRPKIRTLTGHKLLQYLELKRTLKHNSNIIVNNLPHEIYLLIFKYCSYRDIYLGCARVCMKWRKVLKSSRSVLFMKEKFLESWERECYCEPLIEDLVPSTFSEYVQIICQTGHLNFLFVPKDKGFKKYCGKCKPYLRYIQDAFRAYREAQDAFWGRNVEDAQIYNSSQIDKGIFQSKLKPISMIDESSYREIVLELHKKIYVEEDTLDLATISQQKKLKKRQRLAKPKRQRVPSWKKQRGRRPRIIKNGGRFKKKYR